MMQTGREQERRAGRNTPGARASKLIFGIGIDHQAGGRWRDPAYHLRKGRRRRDEDRTT